MEWFYPKRRVPEWKQGWTGKTMASVSAPPLHLLIVFGIVISLMWISQYNDYKAQLHYTAIKFQLFLFFFMFALFIFFMISHSNGGGLNFHAFGAEKDPRRVSY